MRWWRKRAQQPDPNQTVKEYVKDHPDTLPRVRVRPIGKAVQAELRTGPADTLADLYDPDVTSRQFIHPTQEVVPLQQFVPVRSGGQWCDPPSPHRLQLIKAWKDGKPVLQEVRVNSAAKLKELTESAAYRRSRLYESTGTWERQVDGERYRRFVETYSPNDPAVKKVVREAAHRYAGQFREASDPFAYGDIGDGSTGTSSSSVTRDIDQEFAPITGGCFTGETEVPFLDGTVHRFDELARDYSDKQFWVYAVTPDGSVVPGLAHHPRLTGRNKPIVEVELDNGEKVRCTPDHKWMRRDGTYCPAEDLQSGDSLMPLYRKDNTHGLSGYEMVYHPDTNRFGFTHKMVTGRIPKGHIVHHRNFNKKDNSPDNLEVMLRSDHQLLRMKKNVSWWNDPGKREAAARKIGVRLKANNWRNTPEGREAARKQMLKRKDDGFQHWRIGKKGWASALQEERVRFNPLRIARTIDSNRNRIVSAETRAKMASARRAYHSEHGRTEKQLANLEKGRTRHRKLVVDQPTNHMVVSVRPCGFADVYDLTVDKYHNFALSAGAFVSNSYYRQLYLYSHWEAVAKCFEAKNHSELCKTAIGITTDFVLGRQVGWKIRNEKVARIWEEFWARNNMPVRLRQLSDDLTWQGELFIYKDQFLKGFLRIRSYDPGSFMEIVTDPEDVECLDGDTQIALLDGTHPTVRELAEKNEPYWVYSYDIETKRIVPGYASATRLAGTKRCVRVTLDSGDSVVCSYDHPFLMRNGTTYVHAEKLKPGDSLMPLYRRYTVESVWQPETGWEFTHHMVTGGSPPKGRVIHHRNCVRTDNRPVNLQTMTVKEHLDEHRYEEKPIPEVVRRRERVRKKELFKSWTDERRERFAKGVQASWDDPEIRASRVAGMRDAAQKRWASQRDELREGIKKGWIKRKERAQQENNQPQNHKVVSVEDVGEREVYDIQVDKYHNFALKAGVFTHNTVFFFHAQFPVPYQLGFTQYRGINLNIPLSKYVIRQFPPDEMYFLKNNVSATEKWGRSDFYASLGTIKRHRDWVNAVTLRDMLQANLVWKIKLTGDDADVQAFVNNPDNAQLPAFGGTWVENDALTLEPLHTDLTSRGQMGQGSVGGFLTALFAAGQHMPISYFNQMGTGAARATALVQGEPWAKKIDSRQTLLTQVLDHLYETVMKMAADAGRISWSDLRGDDADPEWIWPILYEEDRKAKVADLITAKGMGIISHRRLATTVASEFQMQTYRYEQEMAQIKTEAQDPLLQMWPPHNGGPKSVTAPTFPRVPVPDLKDRAAIGNEEEPEPQGMHARLKGSQARTQFKQDQQAVEAQRDEQFLAEAVRDGWTGPLQLPSGAVVEVGGANGDDNG